MARCAPQSLRSARSFRCFRRLAPSSDRPLSMTTQTASILPSLLRRETFRLASLAGCDSRALPRSARQDAARVRFAHHCVARPSHGVARLAVRPHRGSQPTSEQAPTRIASLRSAHRRELAPTGAPPGFTIGGEYHREGLEGPERSTRPRRSRERSSRAAHQKSAISEDEARTTGSVSDRGPQRAADGRAVGASKRFVDGE